MPSSHEQHPRHNYPGRRHRSRRRRLDRYDSPEVHEFVENIKKRKRERRVSVLVAAILGGILFTAISGRVLYLSWQSWEKVVNRYGPTTESILVEPTDSTAAAILVLAVVFVISTILLVVMDHR